MLLWNSGPAILQTGLLSVTMGFPDSGMAELERQGLEGLLGSL